MCFSDRRTSRCYLHVDTSGRCDEPTTDYVTKAACCCSVGQGWGPSCELCPPIDSIEYHQLCPGGMGYKPNDVTVSKISTNIWNNDNYLLKNIFSKMAQQSLIIF